MKLVNTIFVLLIVSLASAQTLQFKAEGPRYVKVGERFQLQYTLNASVDEFEPPSFGDFDFIDGPMRGSSSNISIINGKTTRSQNYTFTYILGAKTAGNFKIGPAKAVYKKNNVSSNSVNIEVVGNSNANQGQQSGTESAKQGAPSVQGAGDQIFVRLVTDKKTCYVGESITAWVKIYTKVSLSDIDRNYKGPVFSGFYKQDIDIPPITNLEREKVGNDIYYSGTLQKVVLFPQKSGDIRIEPFDLTVYVQKQVKRRSRSPLDDFFGSSYTTEAVKLKSKPVTIKAKALPGNKPNGFSGAVGKFTLSGSLNSNKVKTNDAVSFKLSIKGTGNIKLVEQLNYNLPSTMQVYDPVIKSNIDKSGKRGSKTFEITAIPRHPGTIEIDPFSFVYFDPSAKKYKTLKTQAFKLEVERGESDSNSVVISNLSKEQVELLASDIRYIKPVEKLSKKGDYLIDKLMYKLSYLLISMLFIALLVFNREQIKRNANVIKTKNKKASKQAMKRLKRSKELLGQNKLDLFYEELSKALWGYISDKLNIPQSSLSTDSAKEALNSHEISNELVDELFNTISHAEFARYAPGAADKDPNQVYDNALHLLMGIENSFKQV